MKSTSPGGLCGSLVSARICTSKGIQLFVSSGRIHAILRRFKPYLVGLVGHFKNKSGTKKAIIMSLSLDIHHTINNQQPTVKMADFRSKDFEKNTTAAPVGSEESFQRTASYGEGTTRRASVSDAVFGEISEDGPNYRSV